RRTGRPGRVPRGADTSADGSGGEEIDRLRRRHGRDVLGLEAEQHDPLHELLLEVRVAELRRDDLAGRHRPVRRDREPQDDLALERRVLSERAVVERVDRALVLIEYPLDLLAAARRTVVARAGARPGPGSRRGDPLDGAL